jgi:hypothetical protein
MHSCYLFRLSCQFPFLVLAIRVFLDFNGTSIGYRLFGAFADLNVLNTARMGSFNQADSFRDHAVRGTIISMSQCRATKSKFHGAFVARMPLP